MEKRLEAGWFQRIAWSVLVWGSLGLLAWVPFLYVAIRRGRGSDWGAFAAFVLYECVTLSWSSLTSRSDGDPILGAVALLCLLTATVMLLFAVFDKRQPTQVVPSAYGAPTAPAQGQPYGYPYGR
ncbi:hypothetical protein [Streptomyces hirsutus]|uniref:hypothetical protein n=1 Tax=Streptomyces hirsutus TaxID=35620 RepID=UPI0006E25ADB|nr:hypothetical protein [Streptomyces hirsutus]